MVLISWIILRRTWFCMDSFLCSLAAFFNFEGMYEAIYMALYGPVSNETEWIVRSIRRVQQHHGKSSEHATLSVEISNAFNFVNRKAFLKGVQEHFLVLLAWTIYCYGLDAPYLWSGEDVTRSVTGVRKGSSLGPILHDILWPLN